MATSAQPCSPPQSKVLKRANPSLCVQSLVARAYPPPRHTGISRIGKRSTAQLQSKDSRTFEQTSKLRSLSRCSRLRLRT